MRKIFLAIVTSILLVFGLTGCGAGDQNADTGIAGQKNEVTTKAPNGSGHTTAVFYFSATGTTKDIAERLAKVENADLYEIRPSQPYSSTDLDYNTEGTRATVEQNNKSVRPEIAGTAVDITKYDTIYVGFPIWWGEEPRIIDTFAETYDFNGKTMIPFATSGGSEIGRSGDNLKELSKSGTWKTGKRLLNTISDEELKSWAEEAKK